jgi:hypothetical protein
MYLVFIMGYDFLCDGSQGSFHFQNIYSENIHTATCKVVRVTKITGSKSDDWIH